MNRLLTTNMIPFILFISFNLKAELSVDKKNAIKTHVNLSELKIFTNDSYSHQEFGHSVSVSGNYLAASTIVDDDNGTNAGAVYLYENNASGWQQVQKLQGDDTDTDD